MKQSNTDQISYQQYKDFLIALSTELIESDLTNRNRNLVIKFNSITDSEDRISTTVLQDLSKLTFGTSVENYLASNTQDEKDESKPYAGNNNLRNFFDTINRTIHSFLTNHNPFLPFKNLSVYKKVLTHNDIKEHKLDSFFIEANLKQAISLKDFFISCFSENEFEKFSNSFNVTASSYDLPKIDFEKKIEAQKIKLMIMPKLTGDHVYQRTVLIPLGFEEANDVSAIILFATLIKIAENAGLDLSQHPESWEVTQKNALRKLSSETIDMLKIVAKSEIRADNITIKYSPRSGKVKIGKKGAYLEENNPTFAERYKDKGYQKLP